MTSMNPAISNVAYLDIDSLFTNIPLEKSIEIYTNKLFKSNGIVLGLKKSEFKDLLFLAGKQPYFIFENMFTKKLT